MGRGRSGEGCVVFFCQTPTLAMRLMNMNFVGIVGKKLARVKVQ